MKFRYVGDNESPENTSVLGVPFVKGEIADVVESHTVNGKNVCKILSGLNHFEAVSEAPAETVPVAEKPKKLKLKA
jgi:hypothetical protein